MLSTRQWERRAWHALEAVARELPPDQWVSGIRFDYDSPSGASDMVTGQALTKKDLTRIGRARRRALRKLRRRAGRAVTRKNGGQPHA